MLIKICDIDYAAKNIRNDECLVVHPILNNNKNVKELFKLNSTPSQNMLLYLYIWHPEVDQLITGYISNYYERWFLLRIALINDIERLDLLYTNDHLEYLDEDESIGVIYKKDIQQ